TGEAVKDANVPFRLMKSKNLQSVMNKLANAEIFLVNALLAVEISKQNSIKWIPITFVPRRGGIPSVNFWRFYTLGIRTIKEFWRYSKKKPRS
ncbi:MAG: glycosyltransferase family 2 protein, partial [Bacteriovoracia bacterium]